MCIRDSLGVVHVSAGEVDLILELICCGHAVPDAVDSLGVEFGDFRIPVDLLELCGHAELLANSLGKLGLEADKLAVLHVVHGSEVSNSDDQLALICDVVPIGLIVLLAACKTECKHEGQDCEYKLSLIHISMLWFIIFVALTSAVVIFGVEKGIEKVSKVMMPILVILCVVIAVFALTIDGALAGLKYYLLPDFSKFSSATVLGALGQLFYSMSLAMGIMITYGSRCV